MAYTFGECTYGAFNLAPWLPTDLGNADTWVSRAITDGLQTGSTPQVGSAMVFNTSYPGSSGYGHVGIVTAIGKNGYPIIEEMNAGRDSGGFNKYDSYQTTAYDIGFLEGYIYPPSNAQPTATLMSDISKAGGTIGQTATTTGASVPNPVPWYDWFNPAEWPIAIAGSAATGNLNPAGTIGSAVSGILEPISKGGEVLIGAVVLLVGLWVLIKQAGMTPPPVINVVSKLPMAAKLGVA